MKRFNEYLALKLGDTLSSMAFFYFCVCIDLIELMPVIKANDIIIWCTYISQTVIQLIALPILGAQQKLTHKHHEERLAHHKSHQSSLERIEKHLGIKV